MKKGLLLVVLLLAMASMMAAMAYTSATVNNDAQMTLQNTQDALLALSASEEHNAAYYHDVTANILRIDLDKGNGNVDYGIQPYSEYAWEDLFTVTNNSEHTVDVEITMESDFAPGVRLYAGFDGDWEQLVSWVDSNVNGPLEFTLEPGEAKPIDIKTSSKNGHVSTYEWNLKVNATKQ